MAAVDNTIALQFKPTDTGTDPVKIMNALAQINLVRAHEQLYGAEAQTKLGILPAQIEHLNAQTEQARSTAGLNRSMTLTPYDNDSGASSSAPADAGNRGSYLSYLGSLEKKYNLPEGYLGKTAQLESGFDNNSVSSAGARGVFQFMTPTARQYGLTNPHDPIASAEAAARLASDNRNAMHVALGRDPTAQELYLAHNQGARGSLSAIMNPGSRAVDTLGDLAVTQNGGSRGMTNAQFAQLHAGRFDRAKVPGDAAALPPSAAPASGDINLPNNVDRRVLQQYPQFADAIVAVDEGRMKLSEVPNKARYMVQSLLNRYDKNFDETLWGARNRTQSDLAPNGNSGKMLMAVNQLLPHLNTASQRAEALHNSGYPLANTVKNWWATATSDPRVKTFEEVREVAATDAARLLRGSGQMTEKDIDFWRNNLSSANSPQQLQDQIRLLADDLMEARVSSIEHQYRLVMRKEPQNFVSPEARTALNAIKSRNFAGIAPNGASPSGAPGAGVPGLPAGVPPGSMWSPGRRQFRSPDGKLFDSDGKAL